MKEADFTIVSRPAYITFDCPYCENHVRVPWDLVDEPDCWQDNWGSVFCPNCNMEVYLCEYDYD